MSALAVTRTLACLLLAAGCLKSYAPWPKVREGALPTRSDSFTAQPLPTQMSDADLDDMFRSNLRNYGYLDGVQGVDELRYPESNHPRSAHAYVLLGDSYMSRGERGAAAQAYWTALGLTSKTIGSRRQREEIRSATYRGLARVAESKQQAEWAALLHLCAGMAATYARSESAEASHDDFYHALESQLRAQRHAEAAQRRAARGLLLQKIALGVSMTATVVQGGMGQISSEQVNTQAAQLAGKASAIQRQEQELVQAMSETMGAIASSVGKLREVTAADIPAIQSGRSFVARQVGWYLLAAADPLPYFDGPLAAYVRGRAPLRKVVETARAAFADTEREELRSPALIELALAVVAVERHVAMHERNRVIPATDYIATVCAPDGGAIECFLTAGDLCRAGVEEGCAMLDSVARGEAR